MHGVWKCSLSHCADSSDFEEETVIEITVSEENLDLMD
jgi:hypothetical protein